MEAEFYNKSGDFIDEISGYIRSNIQASDLENFKISEKKYSKERWDKVDKIEVKISDAYHSKY